LSVHHAPHTHSSDNCAAQWHPDKIAWQVVINKYKRVLGYQ
jgi:hypothetical protein